MNDDPNQSMSSKLDESYGTTESDDSTLHRNSLRDAVLFAAVPQVFLFFAAAFATIFGDFVSISCSVIASCLTLALTIFVGLRRQGMPTKQDVSIIKWSFFPVLLLTIMVWFICD